MSGQRKKNFFTDLVVNDLKSVRGLLEGQLPRKEDSMHRAMILMPGKPAEVKFIGADDITHLLGEDLEAVSPFDDELTVLVDAGGKIKGLPLNRAWRDEYDDIIDIFAGPMVIISEKGGLTDEDVVDLLEEFGEVETPDDWEDDEPIDGLISLLKKIFS